MQSIRNIQFTRLVRIDGRLREFNFRKSGKEEQVFNVDVTGDRNTRIFFQMQKEDSAWKIMPGEIPTWIRNKETNLCELIEKELQA
jgi:hypothetical protein